MTADPSTVELVVPNDRRLLPAVDAVLAHACERAGLSGSEQRDLSRAVLDACDESFSLAGRKGNPRALLRLLISDFPNRVEVAIEQPNGGPAPLDSRSVPAAAPDAIAGALHDIKVDLLRRDVREGRPRTVLVKYHAGSKK